MRDLTTEQQKMWALEPARTAKKAQKWRTSAALRGANGCRRAQGKTAAGRVDRRPSSFAAIVLLFGIIGPGFDVPAFAAAASADAETEAERAKLATFETEIAFMHDYLRMPGLAAGILRGRELWWFKGYGYADLAKKNAGDAGHALPPGLVDENLCLHLAHAIGRARQDSTSDTPAETFGIDLESHGTVTVRHIFSHTSGGEPGERYQYDGSRFGKLDRVIEQITGRSFMANLNAIVIRPLGLKNTGRMGDALQARLASPYILNDTGDLVPGAYPTYVGSSAGLVASVADYAKYIVALKENRFLRPETQAIAFTPTRSNAGRDLPYGLGWFVETVEGTKVVWHYGYWDSVSSLVVMVPECDLAFLAFANSDALSRGFRLGRGRVLNSPAASIFLEAFVFEED